MGVVSLQHFSGFSRCVPLVTRYSEESSRLLDALELMGSSVLEAECGAGDDVLDRLGYEYLTAISAPHHAGCEMYCDPTQGAATLDDLAHVVPARALKPSSSAAA